MDNFKTELSNYLDKFKKSLSDDKGDWIVKGFIDIYRNIYTISVDTKVVSKIIELMLFPIFLEFANEYQYNIVLSEHQNHYPDLSFVDEDENKIALDIKSTFRRSDTTANGFTLGAFTGYFRKRSESKNITFPYNYYQSHFVLGIIYSRNSEPIDEKKKYSLDDLTSIISVVQNFDFILQEKWRIANSRPGSGNTKNIGSISNIKDLKEGKGKFVDLGEAVFDHYWMNYLTSDMAKAIDSDVPFRNIEEYQIWKKS